MVTYIFKKTDFAEMGCIQREILELMHGRASKVSSGFIFVTVDVLVSSQSTNVLDSMMDRRIEGNGYCIKSTYVQFPLTAVDLIRSKLF